MLPRNPNNRHYCFWCNTKQYEKNMTTFFDGKTDHFVCAAGSECADNHATSVYVDLLRFLSALPDSSPYKTY